MDEETLSARAAVWRDRAAAAATPFEQAAALMLATHYEALLDQIRRRGLPSPLEGEGGPEGRMRGQADEA